MPDEIEPVGDSASDAEDADVVEGEVDDPSAAVLSSAVAEVMKKLPAPQRRQLEATFLSMQTGPFNPLAGKITSDHITSMIEGEKKDMELGYEDRKEGRRILALIGSLGLVIFAVLVIVLANGDHSNILTQIIQFGIAGAGGFGVSYGVRGSSRRH